MTCFLTFSNYSEIKLGLVTFDGANFSATSSRPQREPQYAFLSNSTNGWRSNPNHELPQTIMVTFPIKRKIGRISFLLRSDLNEPHKFPGEFQIVGTNKPLEFRNLEKLNIVKAKVDRLWTVLAHVKNGYKRDVYVADIPSSELGEYQTYGIKFLRTIILSSDEDDSARVWRVKMWELVE